MVYNADGEEILQLEETDEEEQEYSFGIGNLIKHHNSHQESELIHQEYSASGTRSTILPTGHSLQPASQTQYPPKFTSSPIEIHRGTTPSFQKRQRKGKAQRVT